MRGRFCVKGVNPERVLSRLVKLGVAVYSVQKTDATAIYFEVKLKDVNKVLHVYPRGGAYEVVRLPARGGTRIAKRLFSRVGAILGGLLFVAITCWADGLVLRIQVEAPTVYLSQVEAALKENGVKQYAVYQAEKESAICAQLLALDGVSYCALQKRGSVLVITLKTNAFYRPISRRDLIAERSGKVEKLVLLSGTALVQKGAEVATGDKLVEGRMYSPEGEGQDVAVVAYVVLACTYEGTYACVEESEALAQAYLDAGLENEQAKLIQAQAKKGEDTYAVRLSYTWTQRLWI